MIPIIYVYTFNRTIKVWLMGSLRGWSNDLLFKNNRGTWTWVCAWPRPFYAWGTVGTHLTMVNLPNP